jgi:ribonuclease HI
MLATLEGLKHARQMNFRAVELNVDSMVVVQAILETKGVPMGVL